VAALLRVMQRLVDAGNTVVVIEHNPDVMKNADYIIDLGPGAGDVGGYVVAKGTPEEVAQVPESITGRYLKSILAGKPVGNITTSDLQGQVSYLTAPFVTLP
jgi:excinuclease ABC subunit A